MKNKVVIYNEIVEGLHNGDKLSELLLKSKVFAKKKKYPMLNKFIRLELDGYSFHYRKKIGSHRIIKCIARDYWGWKVETLQKLIPFSIVKIENALSKNESLVLQKDNKGDDQFFDEVFNLFASKTKEGHTSKYEFEYEEIQSMYTLTREKFLNFLLKMGIEDKIEKDLSLKHEMNISTEEKIKELIINNDLKNALNLLSSHNPKLEDEVIVLLSRLQNLNRKERLGVIEGQELQVELNKIRVAIITAL